MHAIRAFLCLLFILLGGKALAATPTAGEPLPPLDIDDRGELVAAGDEFEFVPWSSADSPDTVHIIQYFGAKLSHRDLFSPFTDALEEHFEPGAIHVSSVLNMDAAMWGTTGMVLSELKKNKRRHPQATMVVDEEGVGVQGWDLGEDGTGLIITDARGVVRYFSRQPLDEKEVASTINLVRELGDETTGSDIL